MTKLELIEAYVGGRIDRRHFVRQLTAVGVSAAAALAYAQSLAPRAAAAGATRSQAGFVVRAQADDEEYGVACDLADDLEGAAALHAAAAALLGLLDAGLGTFGEGDFPALDGAFGLLQTMRDQVAEQAAVLETAITDLGGSAATAEQASVTTVDDFLAAVADALSDLAGLYAGVAPAISDGELRQTLTSMAITVGRHAAVANLLVGDSPFPAGLEQPICP